MAQERKRTVPVQKTKDGEPGAAAEAKQAPARARKTAGKAEATAGKAPKAAPKVAKATTAKPAKATAKAAKEAAPKATPARRATATATKRRPRTLQAVPEPTREEIAFCAYLLWEQGAPGGETEHWLRAEAELRAA